jgi:endonuclease/exonuclease/phosphatase family metal-dependent hydrolase
MTSKNKEKTGIFDKFILILNGISSMALLLSYFAPVVDPRRFWIISLIGLAYPVLLIISLVFAGFWFFRKKRNSLISLITILIGFKILLANFSFHQFSPIRQKSAAGNIKVMAYNVHGFGGFEGTDFQSVQKGIFTLINNEAPDIINIEEFYENISTRAQIFNSFEKAVRSKYHYFQPYDYTQWDSTGIAIFSKFPIINRGIIRVKQASQTQAIFADVKYNKQVIRIYCVHLQSTHFENPEHEYLDSLRHFGKINFHESRVIGSKLKDAFIKRSYQVAVIKAHMAKCPYPYIVAGDFNDTPISYALHQMGNGLNNAFEKKGSGMGITYYGDFPHSQIDYILTSPQFDVLNYKVIKAQLSDHYPIISELFLNKSTIH